MDRMVCFIMFAFTPLALGGETLNGNQEVSGQKNLASIAVGQEMTINLLPVILMGLINLVFFLLNMSSSSGNQSRFLPGNGFCLPVQANSRSADKSTYDDVLSAAFVCFNDPPSQYGTLSNLLADEIFSYAESPHEEPYQPNPSYEEEEYDTLYYPYGNTFYKYVNYSNPEEANQGNYKAPAAEESFSYQAHSNETANDENQASDYKPVEYEPTSSGIEYSLPENEYSIPGTEYLLPENEYSIPGTEYPVRETEYPVRETEYPVRETEYPVRETEYPVRETEYPEVETEYSIPDSQTNHEPDLNEDIPYSYETHKIPYPYRSAQS